MADLIGTRNHQADHEHTANVEDEDTEERPTDGNRDVFTRGLGLTNRHADELRADVREQSVCEGAPEAEEDREVLVVHLALQVSTHWAVGVIPVTEPDAVMPWVPAKVDDDAHEEQTYEGDDLDAAEPEFELAENPDTE